ncbi:MAG: riboflavin synthase, partial [Erythrobacter sp.]|nr:riboflavin synthase [Erythrobacter sp.]
MFTGIVTAIGTIASAEQRGDLRLRITAPLDPARIDIGASIACSGVCLTVVERGGTAGDA